MAAQMMASRRREGARTGGEASTPARAAASIGASDSMEAGMDGKAIGLLEELVAEQRKGNALMAQLLAMMEALPGEIDAVLRQMQAEQAERVSRLFPR